MFLHLFQELKFSFDGTIAELEMLQADLDDSGEYTCRLVNTAGETSTTAELVVEGMCCDIYVLSRELAKYG